MQIIDNAIILSNNKYGENSGIVCVLTENYGVYKGLVRGIAGARQRGIYQVGNIIEATWRARLSEHLGNLSGGLLYTGAIAVMDNPLKLAALSSLCSILEVTLQERESVAIIYHSFKNFITSLGADSDEWQKHYILLEVELLSELGFGLDLTECVVTGSIEDLIYVSPKSGRAVSRDAGKPYCDKLLKLPSFLLPSSEGNVSINSSIQINDGIDLCSYFLDKYFFAPHNIRQPQARARFVGMLSNKLPRSVTRRPSPLEVETA